MPRAVLTCTNKAPISPVITPIIIAEGKSINAFSFSSLIILNLRMHPSDKLNGDPFSNDYKIDSTNVLIDVAVKILHNILNDQNVLGFEISYENKAPPIGAPNATLTPHEAPHAIICLFIVSF